MATYVDPHGYVWEKGKVVGRTSPEHAGRSVSRQQYRRARSAREAARLPATDPSKSQKIKVKIGKTSTGKPVYREVDLDEAVELYKKGGREAVAKRFGRAAAERMEFIRTEGGGYRVRYLTTVRREPMPDRGREPPLDVAFQRELQLRAREQRETWEQREVPLDVAFQRELQAGKVREARERQALRIDVYRREGVRGKLKEAKERAFEAWMGALGGSRYFAEKSVEAAKVLAVPALEGYAAVRLLGAAERGAAVLGTKGGQLFEAAASVVKSKVASDVLMGVSRVSKALPWGVRGAGIGTGGVSMVIAGAEAKKALKEGDTERALKIVAATAAAGVGGAAGAKHMPALAPLERRPPQEEFLITYLRGVKERRTLTAWQEGGRITVLESREVSPRFTTERISWKPEQEVPEKIPLRAEEKALRAEYKEGKLSALSAEERRYFTEIKDVAQIREISKKRGTPEETGVALLEKEVMMERIVTDKEPLTRAPLPGELAERVPKRGGRSGREKPSIPFEPPKPPKPRRALPRPRGKGEELKPVDISKVEADVGRIQRAQQRVIVEEQVFREPVVLEVRRVGQRVRTGVGMKAADLARPAVSVAGSVGVLDVAKRAAAGIARLPRSLLSLAQRDRGASASQVERTKATYNVQDVLTSIAGTAPKEAVAAAEAYVPTPPVLRAPEVSPSGAVRRRSVLPRPLSPPKLKDEGKRERSPLARLFRREGYGEEFVMPLVGLRVGGSGRKRRRTAKKQARKAAQRRKRR